jgi:protoporphyrinogen/coproporphyrinogen III oxidase
MISFEDGMETLVKKLAEGKNVRYNTPVKSIRKQENGWQVMTEEGSYNAKKLVVALHINQALKLLNEVEPAPGESIPSATVINVVLGFDNSAQIPFGFGYLAPKTEQRFALGTLFSIHMFPKRAPEGMNLIEVLVGGNRNPERLALDDKELIEKAYRDVRQLINLPKPPVFSSVIRPEVGIPQLEMGYLKYLEYRERLQKENEGLRICGFGWEGIGINDMVKQARQAALDVLRGETSESEPAKAKPIYF